MIDIIKKILWGIATFLLLGGGIYFSIKLKGIQFKFIEMFKGFKTKGKENITPFQTLMMALAARIGVGSLAGTALAIHIGGIGTIFWIWITTLITAPNAFAESFLGVLYKEKDGNYHKGGPSFYIEKGLGKKRLAKVYAIIILIAYIFGFLTIQANTIATSFSKTLNFHPLITGVSLAIISGIIIMKGVKGISKVTGKLVPVMGLTYLGLIIFVLFDNLSLIPNIIGMIVQEAFQFKSAILGILTTMMIGLERSIFATEAGIGSGAIASSASDSNNAKGQGLIQILGIYFTTFIICTGTALMILTSPYNTLNLGNINGIEITQFAFQFHFGNTGSIILSFIILFFAFSTILTGYYYGEVNLKFLNKKVSKKSLMLLKITTLILLVLGSIASATTLWKIVDILVALMAMINMYAIISLRRDIINA